MGVAIEIADASGKIVFMNKHFRTILGLENLNPADTIYVWDFLPSEEERTLWRKRFNELISSRPHPEPLEKKVKVVGGQVALTHVHWSYLTDKSGELKGLLSVITPHRHVA